VSSKKLHQSNQSQQLMKKDTGARPKSGRDHDKARARGRSGEQDRTYRSGPALKTLLHGQSPRPDPDPGSLESGPGPRSGVETAIAETGSRSGIPGVRSGSGVRSRDRNHRATLPGPPGVARSGSGVPAGRPETIKAHYLRVGPKGMQKAISIQCQGVKQAWLWAEFSLRDDGSSGLQHRLRRLY
jgi:hypothetical protein